MPEDNFAESYIHFVSGCRLLESGCVLEAYDKLTESLNKEPHYKTCLFLAKCCELLGRDSEVMNHVRLAYTLQPNNNEAATAFAQLLANQHEAALAIEILQQVLERSPCYGPAQRLMSKIKSG